MRIRITEETIKLSIDGKLVKFQLNDEVAVTDEIGELCVGAGWADDVDGKVETGERVPGAGGRIEPDTLTHPQG